MGNIIKILLIMMLTICIQTSLAISDESQRTPKEESDFIVWKSMSSYEETFLEQYRIIEKDINNDKAYFAFRLMRQIYTQKTLDKMYFDHDIKSEELRDIVKYFIDIAKDPKTAKEYFYKGLFAYPHFTGESVVHTIPEMFEPFEFILKEYPGTVYEKNAYLLLGDNYDEGDLQRDRAVYLYEQYLEKYANDAEIISILYYKLARIYSALFFIENNSPANQGRINIALKYSNKLLDEYPDKKLLGGDILIQLGNHYKNNLKDFDNASKYYNKVFSDPEYKDNQTYQAAVGIISIYKFKKNYENLEKFLEDMKRLHFNSNRMRKLYMKFKSNLEEIKLFNYDSCEYKGINYVVKELYGKPPIKTDEILNFRKEWTENLKKEWPEPPRLAFNEKGVLQETTAPPEGPEDKFSLILEVFEAPNDYYKDVSKKEIYFYEDEQPIEFKITLKSLKDKMLTIWSNDWYKNLVFNAKPYRHLYSYDKDGNMVKEKGYSKENEFIEEEKKRGISLEVFGGEDLKGNKLKPNEEKFALLSILDKEKMHFVAGYYYMFEIGYEYAPGISYIAWESKDSYDIIKPVTPDQIKDWTIRKGDREVKEKKYKKAIKHYLEVLEKETEKLNIRKILLSKLAGTYELDKDYPNAKKHFTELLKHIESEIKAEKDDKELLSNLEGEKTTIEQKIKNIDELIKQGSKK